MIRHNQAPDDFTMPVLIALDKKLAQSKSDDQLRIGSQDKLNELTQRGMRGRLDAESLVTGVLYVALDIVSNAPPPVFHQIKPEYHEIPTLPSDVEQLFANLRGLANKLSRVDVPKLSEKLTGVLTRVDSDLSELDFHQINSGVTNLLGAANHVLTSPDLTNALSALHHTLARAGTLVARVDDRMDPLLDGVTNTLSDARVTLADLRVTVRNVGDLLGPDSGLRPNLNQALEEVSNAGRAIADLAELLDRNPNALLAGKKPPKELP
jgi:paraquat-inducible protein B